MRKIIITALGLSVIAVSSVQMAAAAERHHHARKVSHEASHAQASEQFRNSNNSLDWPAGPDLFLVYNNNGN